MTCRVVVVEDEPLIAADIEFAAQDAGCDILGVARSIDEALAMMAAQDCSGAIVDANLNGQSAKPIIDHLDANALPYILVSGYDRDQLTFLSDDAVLVGKPFSMTELTNAIRQEIFLKSRGPLSNPDS